MDKILVIDKKRQLTEEQKKEVLDASTKPILFDDDCPELSPAMIKAFECSVNQRNRRINREKIS